MPHILIIAAAEAAALAGYKLLKREMGRVGRSLGELREAEARAPVRSGTLVRGADGVYRPVDRQG